MEKEEIIRFEEKELTFRSKIASYDKDEHSIIFIITDGSVDYDNEIVSPAGFFYRKQPKGLYAHNRTIPAVTRLEWVKLDSVENNIKAKFVFDQNDPFSVLLENKYANGFMTDVSIGFRTSIEDLTFNEAGILIHNKWELLEVSLVNLGANFNSISLSLDECNTLVKSKAYQTNAIIKTEVDTLKHKVIIKTAKDEIKTEFNSKFDEIKTDISNMKSELLDTIEVKNNESTDNGVEGMIEEEIGKFNDKITDKFNQIVKEINKLKVQKQKSDIKNMIEQINA
jgi:hypothetical protein